MRLDHSSEMEFARLQTVFENSPVSLWQEDFSDVYHRIQDWRQQGVTNFSEFFRAQPDAVLECSRLISIVDLNQATIQMLKAPDKETLVKSLGQTFTNRSLKVFKLELLALIEGRTLFEHESQMKTLDGEIFDAVIRVFVDDKVEKWANVLVAITNISPLREARLQLKESERNFRNLFDQAPICYQSLDADGELLYVNQTWLNTLGFDRDTVLGKNFAELLSPEDQALFPINFAKFKKEGSVSGIQYQLTGANGRRIHVEYDGQIVTDKKGDFVRTHCVFRDITDQLEIVQERDALSRQNAMIMGTSGECIIGMDCQSLITFANPAVERTTGWLVDEILGKNEHDLLHHTHSDGSPLPLDQCPVLSPVRYGQAVAGETYFWKKDGSSFPVEYTCHPIFEQGNISGAVLVFSDISERRELEQKFQMAQKMEAVGQLAGGIAHDFNNILHAMLSHLDFIEDSGTDPESKSKDLQMVRKCVDRASSLTTQLLAFSRRQILEKENLDLNQLINKVLDLLRRLIRASIELKFQPAEQNLAICADPVQLEQILINLCLNAQDAMPEGGEIHLSTESFHVDRNFIKDHPWATMGHYVMIVFSDTGCGMTSAEQEKVFTPFFTTKETGKGTGLGLASVYGIVKQHEGMIHVYSELDKGTTFKIFLPASPQPGKPVQDPVETQPSFGGSETILLAEDDPMVLESTRRFLESSGYRVFPACNGLEAVDIHDRKGHEIDLYLLDVVMPKMGGHEVLQIVLKNRPDAKILFSSGYSNESLYNGFKLPKNVNLIRKPYSSQQLLTLLRELFEERSG